MAVKTNPHADFVAFNQAHDPEPTPRIPAFRGEWLDLLRCGHEKPRDRSHPPFPSRLGLIGEDIGADPHPTSRETSLAAPPPEDRSLLEDGAPPPGKHGASLAQGSDLPRRSSCVRQGARADRKDRPPRKRQSSAYPEVDEKGGGPGGDRTSKTPVRRAPCDSDPGSAMEAKSRGPSLRDGEKTQGGSFTEKGPLCCLQDRANPSGGRNRPVIDRLPARAGKIPSFQYSGKAASPPSWIWQGARKENGGLGAP